MDTILIVTGYTLACFIGLSERGYPVGWILFSFHNLKTAQKQGFLSKKESNNIAWRVILLLFDFVPQAGQNFHTNWFTPTSFFGFKKSFFLTIGCH